MSMFEMVALGFFAWIGYRLVTQTTSNTARALAILCLLFLARGLVGA